MFRWSVRLSLGLDSGDWHVMSEARDVHLGWIARAESDDKYCFLPAATATLHRAEKEDITEIVTRMNDDSIPLF